MSNNPYKSFDSRSFWSRAVASNFDLDAIPDFFLSMITKREKIASAGSCFASNIVPYLEKNGYNYLRNEEKPLSLKRFSDNLGYDAFSARYGYIYTTRHLLQLYARSVGSFLPFETFWEIENKYVDPFRPGLNYRAESAEEFIYLTTAHLKAVRKTFEEADTFFYTLGLTEAWVSSKDGAVYPACPGTISGEFDEKKYEFKNFTVQEIIDDFTEFATLLRRSNPTIKFILTVSPVPLVATASGKHVLHANTYSKSVLRVAAEELSKKLNNVFYFPAYEIISSPVAWRNALGGHYESDLRNIKSTGIEEVMKTLFSTSTTFETNTVTSSSSKIEKLNSLAQQVIKAQCDEELQDKDEN
jgi:hypothetical protein